MIGTGVVFAGLVVIVFVLGRRHVHEGATGDMVAPDGAAGGEVTARRPARFWLALLGALLVSLVMEASPSTWIGLAVVVAAVAALGHALLRASQRPGWTVRHVAAAGLGLLPGRGLLAFTTTLLADEVDQAAKLCHNVVMLGVVLLVGAVALRKRTAAWN